MDEQVWISAISTMGGIAIAYITYVASKKVQAAKAEKQPKDRMEQMFDGYERLIRQKDKEDDRKQAYIKTIERELQAVKEHAQTLESALELTNNELQNSRNENQELRQMLSDMRKEYKSVKTNMEETT